MAHALVALILAPIEFADAGTCPTTKDQVHSAYSVSPIASLISDEARDARNFACRDFHDDFAAHFISSQRFQSATARTLAMSTVKWLCERPGSRIPRPICRSRGRRRSGYSRIRRGHVHMFGKFILKADARHVSGQSRAYESQSAAPVRRFRSAFAKFQVHHA
eukprot:3677729-Prymnesium_polylepis.1